MYGTGFNSTFVGKTPHVLDQIHVLLRQAFG